VDYWNEAALRTYRRLGFTLRPLGAAAQTRQAGTAASVTGRSRR
jgi:hypothetical protein